ncbi:Trigger factor [Linum grandiflorum]
MKMKMTMMEGVITPKAFFPACNFTGLNRRTTVLEAVKIRYCSIKAITSFPNGLRCSVPASYFTRLGMFLSTFFYFIFVAVYEFIPSFFHRRIISRSSPLVSALVTGANSVLFVFSFNWVPFSTYHHVCHSPLDVRACSSQFVDFQVVTNSTEDSTVLKISVEVSGTKTRAIFDDAFHRMVEAAQPIPGFRRVKGGKTPNIPKDVLLEILGASRVYKQVIQKVINSCVAEYVDKQGLEVGKDLEVEQSFEDLEDAFNPGEKFKFDALLRLQLN